MYSAIILFILFVAVGMSTHGFSFKLNSQAKVNIIPISFPLSFLTTSHNNDAKENKGKIRIFGKISLRASDRKLKNEKRAFERLESHTHKLNNEKVLKTDTSRPIAE